MVVGADSTGAGVETTGVSAGEGVSTERSGALVAGVFVAAEFWRLNSPGPGRDVFVSGCAGSRHDEARKRARTNPALR